MSLRRWTVLLAVAGAVFACLGAGTYNQGQYARYGGAGYPGQASTGVDTFTYLFAWNDTCGSLHSGWPASYDSLVTDYCYGFADSSTADSCRYYSYQSLSQVWGNDETHDDRLPHGSQRISRVWFDLGELPDDCTLLTANLCVTYRVGSQAYDANDGIIAILDTIAADTAWMDGPPCYTATNSSDTHQRNMTWLEADERNSVAWDPPLRDREDWHDYGIISGPYYQGHTTAAHDTMTLDVTRALQVLVDNDLPNAGFVLGGYRNTALAAAFDTGPHSTNVNYQPFLVVTYTTEQHVQPWGGKPIAINFGIDDGLREYNLLAADTFHAHDINIDMYLSCHHINLGAGGNDLLMMAPAQIESLYDAGVGVVYHSRTHCAMLDGDGCDYDTCYAALDSADIVIESDIDSFLAHVSIPRNDVLYFGTPGLAYSQEHMEVLRDLGFYGCRTAYNATFTDCDATSDSALYLSAHDTVNVYNVAIFSSLELWGAAADNWTTAEIREELGDHIARAWRNGQCAIIYFWHDDKAGTYGDYLNGADPADLHDACVAVEYFASALAPLKFGEIIALTRARSRWCDPPTGFKAADVFGVTAADKMWMCPK